MNRLGVTLLGLTLCSLLWMNLAWGEETTVIILSPKEGEVVSSENVKIDLMFIKGEKGDHLHFYVNDRFNKTTRRESAVLWNLKEGRHTIEVRAASREKDAKGLEHKELGPKASITIMVQGRSAELQKDRKINR